MSLLKNRTKKTHRVKTVGEKLANGTAIELIRDPAHPERLNLAIWHKAAIRVKKEFSYSRRIYEPLQLDGSIVRALQLPSRIAPPETTGKLYTGTENLLADSLHQSESCTTGLTFAVFMSWLFRLLPMAPMVWIFAPEGSPRFATLHLLHVLCRHSLVLADVKRSDIRHLPVALEPTCLIVEPDTSPAMLQLLRNSSRPGINVPSGQGLRSLYCPKIIVSSTRPDDSVFGGDVLQLSLHPVADELKLLDQKLLDDLADEFQARFVAYRLRNFSSVRMPKFDVADLTLSTQELARTVGAAVIGDIRLQEKILPMLRAQDEKVLAERSSTVDSVVLEALLSCTHTQGVLEIRSCEVAEKTSAIFLGRGFERVVSPESVGWAMKGLGLPIGRIDSAGNGLKLTAATCRLVHELAQRHGVFAMRARFQPGCPYCEELRHKFSQRKKDDAVA